MFWPVGPSRGFSLDQVFEMKRDEVRQNRIKWAEFLLNKKRKKAVGMLDAGKGSRCCLGHGAYCLDVVKYKKPDSGWRYGEKQISSYAPEEFVNLVGLWEDNGSLASFDDYYYPKSYFLVYDNILSSLSSTTKEEYDDTENGVINHRIYLSSLTAINDDTRATPQQIGAYLMTVIEGGNGTPFKPLTDWAE